MPLRKSKLLEIWRNLKSDAVPQAPRVEDETEDITSERHTNESSENHVNYDSDEPEEIIIEPEPEPECDKGKKKKKNSKGFYDTAKDSFNFSKQSSKTKNESSTPEFPCNVNTQATGNAVSIVNSKHIHIGNSIYNSAPKQNIPEYDNEDEEVKKDGVIKMVLNAKIKPEHEYLDYISQNLGVREGRMFFRKIGFTPGRIETVEHDHSNSGISEVWYQLLLEWVRKEDDPSLGRLSTILWNNGNKLIVKKLSTIYKTNIKNKE